MKIIDDDKYFCCQDHQDKHWGDGIYAKGKNRSMIEIQRTLADWGRGGQGELIK